MDILFEFLVNLLCVNPCPVGILHDSSKVNLRCANRQTDVFGQYIIPLLRPMEDSLRVRLESLTRIHRSRNNALPIVLEAARQF